MDLVKVEGYSSLRKDSTNGGVVNVDKKSYSEYQKAKRIAEKKHREQEKAAESVHALKNEINTIRSEISELKDLITTLAQKM